jgi:hypothetical protein
MYRPLLGSIQNNVRGEGCGVRPVLLTGAENSEWRIAPPDDE